MDSQFEIKNLRHQTRLSQSKFCKCFGIPVSTLQDWEQGNRRPPDYVIDMMKKIAKYEHLIKDTNGASV